MASISRPHKAAGGRSGGKILRTRRTPSPRTPYDRPSHLLPNSAPQNPNWLSELILSPARMIATGAGKVLSVFRSDSSSSSSSDEDSTSEGDSADATDVTGVPSQDANEAEKFDSLGNDPPVIEWKSEIKCTIEHLLMQETFSREECDRLIHIIKSRVVDPIISGGIEGRLDVGMPDLCSTAVTEAKKWLEEKKLGSNSKPQLEYGTYNLNTAVSPHITEGEIGSPVDLAKSYMRERPPWSSPSMKDSELKSPSPMGTQLFKEDTPYFYSGNSIFKSKLIRDSPSTSSWNITEEIRKVRSKATEDMLRTRPLLMTDVSMLAFDNIRSCGSLVADKTYSVSQIAQDRLLNQSSLDLAPSISQRSQDVVAIRTTRGVEALWGRSEGRLSRIERLQPSEDMKADAQNGNTAAADGPKDTGCVGQPFNCTMGEDSQDSRSHKTNDSAWVEVTVVDGGAAANGFPSPRSSLHSGQEGEENDVEATVSQNGSSMQHEVMEEEEIVPPSLKRKASKTNDTTAAVKERGGGLPYASKGTA